MVAAKEEMGAGFGTVVAQAVAAAKEEEETREKAPPKLLEATSVEGTYKEFSASVEKETKAMEAAKKAKPLAVRVHLARACTAYIALHRL